jgi:hypothetical protein
VWNLLPRPEGITKTKVGEKRVPRRILDVRERKDEEMDEENCIMRRFIMCPLHQILG